MWLNGGGASQIPAKSPTPKHTYQPPILRTSSVQQGPLADSKGRQLLLDTVKVGRVGVTKRRSAHHRLPSTSRLRKGGRGQTTSVSVGCTLHDNTSVDRRIRGQNWAADTDATSHTHTILRFPLIFPSQRNVANSNRCPHKKCKKATDLRASSAATATPSTRHTGWF